MPVITVAHHKGGSGKTTQSMHIAGDLTPDEIIDLDVHEGISVLNKLRPDDRKLPVSVFTDTNSFIAHIRKMDEAGKTVLVDCGGFDSDLTRAAIAVADLLIVPVNDSPTELIGLAKFDQALKVISQKLGFDVKAHVLLCKTPHNKKHFPKMEMQISQSKHMTLLQSVIPYRTGRYGFQDCLNDGMGITEIKHGRSSSAGKELRALTAEINTLLQEQE